MAYSNTIEKFEDNWKEFQITWSVRYENAVEYLSKTWIDPHKEKFVLACTNLIRHFGHRVTSRGEGAHKIVKEFIGSSMAHLVGSCERIFQSIESVPIKYTMELAKQQMKILPFAQPTPRGEIFQDINRKISYYPLWKVFEQVKLLLLTCSFQSLSYISTARKSTTSRNYRRKAMLFHFHHYMGNPLRASAAPDHRRRKETQTR